METLSQKAIDEVTEATRHYFETGERPPPNTLSPQAQEIWEMRFKMHPDPLVLTPEQIATADVLLDHLDKRSLSAKLKSLHISTATYQAWMRDPVFQRYYTNESNRRLTDSLPEANTALLHKVSSGDSQSIKFYFELTGRFNQTAPETAATIQNMQLVIATLLEMIQARLSPSDILMFAQELEARTSIPATFSQTPATQVLAATSEQIVTPPPSPPSPVGSFKISPHPSQMASGEM